MNEKGHSLIEYESDFLEDGERAVCECGWKSERQESTAKATMAHYEHVLAEREQAHE